MPPKEKYSDSKLRDEVKEDIKKSDKGGEPGQWSARKVMLTLDNKAQMMAKEYKKRGGDYNTPKSSKDESQKNLEDWGDEEWQTKDGSGEAKKEDGSRKRYLPKKAWEQMSEKEKEETDEKKQEESKKGKQFVGNTGKAKNARKNVSEGNENEDKVAKNEESSDDNNNDNHAKSNRKSPRTNGSQKKSTGKTQGQNQKKQAQSNGSKSGEKSNNEEDESENDDTDDSSNSSQQENKTPSRGQKRSRATKDEGSTKESQSASTPKKKQKTSNQTIGSNHDAAGAPAKQGSNSRLPKKGQKKVHWKAMPGWVEGEVVEVVEKDKEVNGKKVKASKREPKVVLKSKSSGKICVHRADNVYFD